MSRVDGGLRGRLSLIVVADPTATDRPFLQVVQEALQGGAPAVQLRAKQMTARDMTELARAMASETRRAGALLFVNDRVDVAMAAGADGAHIGDDDIPLRAARAITPPGFLLGRSVDTPDEARLASEEGADYLGVGPVFATASKMDTGPVIGIRGIAATVAATSLPVVAIGGITRETAGEVIRTGAAGVAVIRAVMAAEDPGEEVRELLAQIASTRGSPARQ